MRCSSYSTAFSYDTALLFQNLQEVAKIDLYRSVIHAQIKDNEGNIKDAFYFPYGVVVFWGFTEDEEKRHLHILKQFEKKPLPKIELDKMSFSYGEKIKIQADEIILPNNDSLTKLAISYGLAQSVKLTIFEEAIQKTIDQTNSLPKELAKRGKILLSRKETAKKMGEIFLERNFVNLHSEILDTPEFLWEKPELEPFYQDTIHYLDINKRVELLNKRLNILHELFEILSNQINQRHSFRLEMIIIILILIEVVLALLKDLFHLL